MFISLPESAQCLEFRRQAGPCRHSRRKTLNAKRRGQRDMPCSASAERLPHDAPFPRCLMCKEARDMCYSFRVYIPAPEMIERAPGLRLDIEVCRHDG